MSERCPGTRLPLMALPACLQGRIALLAVVVAAILAGCAATAANRGNVNDPTVAQREREAHCRNRMYIERGARGRAAVNWSIYDACMRETATATSG